MFGAVVGILASLLLKEPARDADLVAADLEATVEPAASGQTVLGGLCGTFSWVVAPGKICSISTATFIKFGELDNRRSERVERLRQAFGKTSVKADIPADIHKALWEKFLLVTAFGGVGAVSRAPIGIIRTIPETRALLQQCMEEVAAVARARGIQLDDTVVTDTMRYVDSLAANATTSLQRDIAEGKPSEIDYWNGSVVRQGRAVMSRPLSTNSSITVCCRKNREHEARWCFPNEPREIYFVTLVAI